MAVAPVNPWKLLHGVFCIYKPVDVIQRHVRKTIICNLVQDLNKQFVPKKEQLITIEGCVGTKLEVNVQDKLAVHPLAIGSAFVSEDLKINFANYMDKTTSGVCIVGINNGVSVATLIKHSRLIRTYRLTGLLGVATINFHHSGKPVETSRYHHVKPHHIQKVLMTIQAAHQKRAMTLVSETLDPQEAYEAFSEEGIVRPSHDSHPLAYNMKCIEFNPPHFTIEMACINENEHFLRKVIHDTGLMLKTNATTMQSRCIRYGPFTVDDALLRKHWRLEHVIDNINSIRTKIDNIRPKTPSIKEMKESTL